MARRSSARSGCAALRAKAAPDSWRADEQAYPPDLDAPVNAWERAAVWGARYLAERVVALGADAVLAGAGVANLVGLARRAARAARPALDVQLTAEIGLWGYDATPGRPVRAEPSQLPDRDDARRRARWCSARSSAARARRRSVASAARRSTASATSTRRASSPDPFLVGSGGGNDVASTATENVVVATLTPQRTPADCWYVTSPGRAVRALVTDLGLLEKQGDLASSELVLTAVPAGDAPIADRIAAAPRGVRLGAGGRARRRASSHHRRRARSARCASWDPRGWFLRAVATGAHVRFLQDAPGAGPYARRMAPRFDFIGVVVSDMASSLAFYRQLGLDIPAEADASPHVEVVLPGGLRLAWDTEETVRSFDDSWTPPSGGHRIALAFACDDPADVDSTYAALVESGRTSHRAPWDAFWGQRYAVVLDPDGNHVELFAAIQLTAAGA